MTDFGYEPDLLTVIQAGYCVDPDRIAAAGFSNGAGLVGYLACALAGRIAAFAAVEAEFFEIPGGCRQAHPASILDVQVVTDPVAPYAGVPARGSPDYFAPPVPAWLQSWARRDGCRGGPLTFVRSPAGVGQRWSGCDDTAGVTGYRLAAGGHSWPRALGGIPGTQEITDFLTAHPHGIPFAVARGPGGTAWVSSFTGYFEHGRVLEQLGGRSGPRVVTLADPASDVDALTAGPAGSMWFTDWGAGKIGELAAGGALRLFADPSPYSGLNDIAAGPDGAMWYTGQAGLIGRLTPAGTFTQLVLPSQGSAPDGITAGPGRTIWVAETGADAIARITLLPGPAGG